jgi:hypothetical protein
MCPALTCTTLVTRLSRDVPEGASSLKIHEHSRYVQVFLAKYLHIVARSDYSAASHCAGICKYVFLCLKNTCTYLPPQVNKLLIQHQIHAHSDTYTHVGITYLHTMPTVMYVITICRYFWQQSCQKISRYCCLCNPKYPHISTSRITEDELRILSLLETHIDPATSSKATTMCRHRASAIQV